MADLGSVLGDLLAGGPTGRLDVGRVLTWTGGSHTVLVRGTTETTPLALAGLTLAPGDNVLVLRAGRRVVVLGEIVTP